MTADLNPINNDGRDHGRARLIAIGLLMPTTFWVTVFLARTSFAIHSGPLSMAVLLIYVLLAMRIAVDLIRYARGARGKQKEMSVWGLVIIADVIFSGLPNWRTSLGIVGMVVSAVSVVMAVLGMWFGRVALRASRVQRAS